MSQALPFMTHTAILYGSTAVDVGVDPIGFALSEENMRNLRYSEIKHKKLPMPFILILYWDMETLQPRFSTKDCFNYPLCISKS